MREASVSSGAWGSCCLDMIYSPFALIGLATGNSVSQFWDTLPIETFFLYWSLFTEVLACPLKAWHFLFLLALRRTWETPPHRVSPFLFSQVLLSGKRVAGSHTWCCWRLWGWRFPSLSASLLPRSLMTHGFLQPRSSALGSGGLWGRFWCLLGDLHYIMGLSLRQIWKKIVEFLAVRKKACFGGKKSSLCMRHWIWQKKNLLCLT